MREKSILEDFLKNNLIKDDNFQKTIIGLETKYTILKKILIEKWGLETNIDFFDYYFNNIFKKIKDYENNMEKIYEIEIWNNHLYDLIKTFQSNSTNKITLIQWIKHILKSIEDDFKYINKTDNLFVIDERKINMSDNKTDFKTTLEITKHQISTEKKEIEEKYEANKTIIQNIKNSVIFWKNQNQKIETEIRNLRFKIWQLEKQKVNNFKNYLIFIFSGFKNNKNKKNNNLIKIKQQEITSLEKTKNDNFKKIDKENKKLAEFKKIESNLKTNLISNLSKENALLNIENDYKEKYLKQNFTFKFKINEKMKQKVLELEEIVENYKNEINDLIIENSHIVEKLENEIFHFQKTIIDLECEILNKNSSNVNSRKSSIEVCSIEVLSTPSESDYENENFTFAKINSYDNSISQQNNSFGSDSLVISR